MKQLEVQIMGQSYLLGCPEGGEGRLQDAVEKVDTAMCKIRDAGKVRARDRIAVLAALNLAFELPDKAAVAAVAVASNAAAQSKSVSPSLPLAGDEAALLSNLLQRLDAVLGEDGRLL
ncbi:cell division protein ZapA [Rhodoferax sp. OV413]|uniref:cell division protein ZapA n=1 Tax=Rhodoferax sp. OV413 TaxID=1855285 RepID=UPI0025DBA480|nr:cell division protein ZapA [Rhodoferax sp. OV413]